MRREEGEKGGKAMRKGGKVMRKVGKVTGKGKGDEKGRKGNRKAYLTTNLRILLGEYAA